MCAYRLTTKLDKMLDSRSSEARSQAVMAIAAVGIKSDKTLRVLIDVLGLDSSDYVRLQVSHFVFSCTNVLRS